MIQLIAEIMKHALDRSAYLSDISISKLTDF